MSMISLLLFTKGRLITDTILIIAYCNISNCSSRGVIRDRLDEFAPLARCGTRAKIRPVRFFFWFRHIERFICRPGHSATLSVTRDKLPISSIFNGHVTRDAQ